MGCKNSTFLCSEITRDNVRSEINKKPQAIPSHVVEEAEPVIVTPEQKKIIFETWQSLIRHVTQKGVINYINLFDTHPDVQDVFMPFKGIFPLYMRHSEGVKAHGLQVMGFVEKVVARLDEREKLERLLKEIGRKHAMYGTKLEYVDVIGPLFVRAIKPALKEHWNDEVEDAWFQLFKYMTSIMKTEMKKFSCC